MIILWLDVIFIMVYAGIMLFLLAGIYRTPEGSHNHKGEYDAITVIVAVRNEQKTIRDCLAALQRQNYCGKLEVIIVDDHSTDATPHIISEFLPTNRHWKMIDHQCNAAWRNPKKAAIAAACEQATGDILLFTDGDCRPPRTWVTAMAAHFDPITILVAGFSPLSCAGNRLWRRLLNMISLADAFIAAGAVGRGIGATCTGRNLAYRKTLIGLLGGYNTLPDAPAGDDDAILQAACEAKKGAIKYAFIPASQVPALGPSNWRDFIQQKKRHLSAGKYYPLRQKTGYFLLHAGNFGLWLLIPFALMGQYFTLLFILAKMSLDWVCMKSTAKKLSRRFSSTAFLLWQFLFPYYHIVCWPAALAEKFSWKKVHKD